MKTLEELTQTIAQMNHWPATKMLPFVVSEFPSIQREYDACELTSRKQFEDLQSTEARCVELAQQLAAMKQERDDIQLRLHAIDHAYNEQQRLHTIIGESSGAFCREMRATIEHQSELIKRQRQFIRTLYTSRNKKKAK